MDSHYIKSMRSSYLYNKNSYVHMIGHFYIEKAACSAMKITELSHDNTVAYKILWGPHGAYLGPTGPRRASCARLGNSVTGFMISDESGNRFFPTAVTDYWQDKAACRHEDQRKHQISWLSSMSMVVIVRYLSSGPQLLYTMPWGLQTLKNMMNYTRCEGSYTNDE